MRDQGSRSRRPRLTPSQIPLEPLKRPTDIGARGPKAVVDSSSCRPSQQTAMILSHLEPSRFHRGSALLRCPNRLLRQTNELKKVLRCRLPSPVLRPGPKGLS